MATTPIPNTPKDWYPWYIAWRTLLMPKEFGTMSEEDELLELQEPTLPKIVLQTGMQMNEILKIPASLRSACSSAP
jgi:hypothetical protein